MSKHHLSHASELYFGEGNLAYGVNGRPGAHFTPVSKVSLGSPAVSVTTAAAAAQAVAGAANLTLNGTLASGGVVTFLTPRNIQAVSTGAGDTTQTLTITGTCIYGCPMVETVALNGVTIVKGLKAFKKITQIAVSAACAGNVSVGNSTALGLPYKLVDKSDLMQTWFNGVVEATVPTVVVGDATAVTATTGDVRGTIILNTALNGSAVYVYMATYPSSHEATFGLANYAG